MLNLRRFNTDGTQDFPFSSEIWGSPRAIAIQASGKIVVGGVFLSSNNGYKSGLFRLNANGSYDSSFNDLFNNLGPTLFPPNAIAIQPDQKIVTTGYYGYFADFSIARLAGLNVPVVAPGIATNLSPTSATLNATVNPSGFPTTVQFEYGTTTAYGNIVPVTISPNAGTSALRVSAALSGLAPATAYHWRLVATNSEGTTTVADRVFVSGVAPDVAPGAPSGLTQTSFTMTGTINPRGFAATAQFQYGTTTAYGNNVEIALSPDDGIVNQSVSAALSNLAPATTYHWRIVAMNAHGSNQTTDQTFTTPAFTGAQPLVTASAVSGVTKTAATLGGTVNANGFATIAQFEYGTTIAYGSSSTATLSQNNGVTAQPVSAALSNLLPGRVYHWRLVAVNANGTSTTADQTFTTQALIGDWKLTHLGDENAPDNGDPDGDGLSTLAEYGMGTLPQSPSNPLAVTSFNYGDGTRLRTYIQRDPMHSDVTVKVLASSSLAGPWTTVAISSFGAQFTGPGYVNGDNSAPGVKTIEVRDIATAETSPVRYMRVQVSR